MAVSSNITISQNSQNIANNTSNITVRVKVTTTGESWNGYDKPGTCTIDGTPYNFTHNIPYQATTTIFEKTLNVSHNSNGEKTVSASFTFETGISAGTISGSTSKKLTTIPRTSNVSLSKTNFNIGETITIYTNRKSSSFTHTAVIKFNGSTVRTATGIGASVSYATSELFAKIPNANRGTGTVELTTYSGSTRIGSSSVSFTGNVVNSNPTFNNFDCQDTNSTTLALTGNNQKYIRKYSNIKVTITSANKMVARNSAVAKYYNVIMDNKTQKINYSTSTVYTTINNMNNNVVTVFAVDSRNNQTSKTKSLDIVPYSEILLQTVKVERKGGIETKALITLSGKYSNIDFGSKTNTVKSIKLRAKNLKAGGNYTDWVDIKPLITINTQNGTFSSNAVELTTLNFTLGVEYDIQIQVEDELSSDIETVRLNSGKVLFSAIKDKGICIGGIYNESVGGAFQLDNKNVIAWINSKQDKQKHILKAILTNDQTILTSSKAYDSVLIPMSQSIKLGNLLTFSNGQIVVGSGVHDVKISSKCIVSSTSKEMLIALRVFINSSEVSSSYMHSISGKWATLSVSESIVNAKEGDKISAKMYIDTSGQSVGLRKYGSSTFLQAEVVD